MEIHVKLEGGEKVARALASLGPRLSTRVMNQALAAGGAPVKRRMEQLAPRSNEAPHLAEHISISPVRSTALRGGGVAVGPTPGFFYGFFSEFGTVKEAAHPWARPAFDETQRQALAIIGREIWASLAARGATSGRGSGGGVGL